MKFIPQFTLHVDEIYPSIHITCRWNFSLNSRYMSMKFLHEFNTPLWLTQSVNTLRVFCPFYNFYVWAIIGGTICEVVFLYKDPFKLRLALSIKGFDDRLCKNFKILIRVRFSGEFSAFAFLRRTAVRVSLKTNLYHQRIWEHVKHQMESTKIRA